MNSNSPGEEIIEGSKSIYGELRELSAEYVERNDRYLADATRFARDFTKQFAEHLQVPNESVVRIEKSTISAAAVRSYDSADFETLNWDEEGYFHFGVHVHISISMMSYVTFTFFVQFFMREATCELHIEPDGTFKLDTNDPTGWRSAHDQMVNVLRNVLKQMPWEAYKGKALIGFTAGR